MTRLNSQLDHLYDTKFRNTECSHFCYKCALNAVGAINEHVRRNEWFTESYRNLIQKALQNYLVDQRRMDRTQGEIAVDALRQTGAWDSPTSEGR